MYLLQSLEKSHTDAGDCYGIMLGTAAGWC